jgi:hypothetical protein
MTTMQTEEERYGAAKMAVRAIEYEASRLCRLTQPILDKYWGTPEDPPLETLQVFQAGLDCRGLSRALCNLAAVIEQMKETEQCLKDIEKNPHTE